MGFGVAVLDTAQQKVRERLISFNLLTGLSSSTIGSVLQVLRSPSGSRML